MTFLRRVRIAATCTASNATVFSEPVQGALLHSVLFTKSSASGWATGATCVLSFVGLTSAIDTDVSWDVLTFVGTSLSQMIYPRREMQTTAAASGGAMGGVMIPAVDGKFKLTVASGGASGRGTFDLFLEGVV